MNDANASYLSFFMRFSLIPLLTGPLGPDPQVRSTRDADLDLEPQVRSGPDPGPEVRGPDRGQSKWESESGTSDTLTVR